MRRPASTYRLQCRGGVRLSDVTFTVGYLHSLGISDLYLSPIALAQSGSTHGYDVCSPNELDPDVGDLPDLENLSRLLTERGMGLLLDIVPNHMAADESRNAWWRDVLERGLRSAFAIVFDIDWHPPNPALTGKVLVPVLDKPYGEVLDAGELTAVFADGRWHLQYGSRRFPLVLDGPEMDELNRAAGGPALHDRLHEVLERQAYRLAHWRTASEEINYRRFFNIEHLIGVRVEDPAVFEATHWWLSRLVEQGIVTGVRVDHPDGLARPAEYLSRLQAIAGGDPDAGENPLYVVVEKILVGDEQVPDDWPVQGTTGYDFLNQVNGLFVARHRLKALEKGYARFVGRRAPFAATEYQAKKEVINATFAGDLERLVLMVGRLADRNRRARDLTRPALRRALVELGANLPVYRTYIDDRGCTPRDRRAIQTALDASLVRRASVSDQAALQFVVDCLVEPARDADSLAFVLRWQQFTGPVFAKAVEDMAFFRDNTLLSLNEVGGDPTHVTGIPEFHAANTRRAREWPYGLLATTTHDTKLSEDVRARLDVLSEADAEWLTLVNQWRRLNARLRTPGRAGAAPDRHDEYRFYQLLIGLWPADSDQISDSLVERITGAMIKAAREANRRTNWMSPDDSYERALTTFIAGAMTSNTTTPFQTAVARFARSIARGGMVNSLAQTLLKIASPGVPDFYQGTELWSLRLTDPDNRQAVDVAYRHRMLDDLTVAASAGDRRDLLASLLAHWEDGRIKMFVTREALCVRRNWPDLFTVGDYLPLSIEPTTAGDGPQVIAFARALDGLTAVAAVPRFSSATTRDGHWPVGAVWGDAAIQLPEFLARQTFTDYISGMKMQPASDGRLAVSGVLRHCPVALLVATRG